MDQKPMLIGVRHQQQYLEEVIGFLKKAEVSGKKVMLEITGYPIPQKYWDTNPGFCTFFDGIAQFVKSNEGILILGDSEELVEKAKQKMNSAELNALFYTAFSTKWWPAIIRIQSEEREPYFLKVAEQQHPDIIVLAKKHADYLSERLASEYEIIPKIV